MVLNDSNENDLQCKISSKVHSHGDETLITKRFFCLQISITTLYNSHGDETLITKRFFLFANFHYHLILPLPMVMHWNEFYEENEMIEIGQALHQDSQDIFQPKLH